MLQPMLDNLYNQFHEFVKTIPILEKIVDFLSENPLIIMLLIFSISSNWIKKLLWSYQGKKIINVKIKKSNCYLKK